MSTWLLIQFILCPLVFFSLLWVTAPYGRHHKSGWGPSLPNRNAWVLMELPALLVISILVLGSPAAFELSATIPLALWLFHYSYRTLIFPALMHPSDKTFPAILVMFAILFNTLNGYNNAQALQTRAASGQVFPDWNFWIGSLLFLAGFIIHFHSDRIIRLLRKPGQTGYSIPRGGLFHWVSSPHYLGEIIQWTGWAILSWSLAGLAFAIFTFCNLAPRAISNHAWYRDRFPGYPAERKILVPGLW